MTCGLLVWELDPMSGSHENRNKMIASGTNEKKNNYKWRDENKTTGSREDW